MEEQAAELARETKSSVVLKRNAKGEYAWDVKLYFEDGGEMASLDLLKSMDGRLRGLFLQAE